MLNASFGCISYLRGIFPDDSFYEERYYANQGPSPKQNLWNRPKDTGQRLMRLKRNFSPETTALLDYLVGGPFTPGREV